MILLKSEQRPSVEVVGILGSCEMTVNNWLKRYQSEGIEGLRTRPGRGRKAAGAGFRSGQSRFKAEDFRCSCRTDWEFRERVFAQFTQAVSEKNACRYKRIRKRLKGKPDQEIHRVKKEVLGELETFSRAGLIELYYGDESGVSLEPCVPYGWQFTDEAVSMPTAKGKGINCFGLFTRSNKAVTAISESSICRFRGRAVGAIVISKKRWSCWIMRGFTRANRSESASVTGSSAACSSFMLPRTYSPHLNITETVWRKLKYEWLAATDYEDGQRLRYSVRQIFNEFGKV